MTVSILNLSFGYAFVKLHVPKHCIILLFFGLPSRLWLELTDILQYIIIPLGFLLPSHVVVGGPRSLDSR